MIEHCHSSLKLVTGPGEEPVLLAAAKLAAHVDGTALDADITAMITEARQNLEAATARAFITQTWRLSMDRFPVGPILLKVCPVIAVTSIGYVDPAGAAQTVNASEYLVDVDSEPGRIHPKVGKCWPTVDPRINAVTITFTAGYGAAAAVPENIKRAIKLLVAETIRHPDATSARKGSDDLFQKLVRSLAWGKYP